MYIFKVILLSCISSCLVAEVTVSSNVTVVDALIVDNSSVIILEATSSIQSSLSYTHSDTNSTTGYESDTSSSSIASSLVIDSITYEPSTGVVFSPLYLNNTDTIIINQSTPWHQADVSSFSTDISPTDVISPESSQVFLTSERFIIATSGVDVAISGTATTSGNISATALTLIDEEINVLSTFIHYSPIPDISSSLESSYVGVQSDSLISNTPALYSETFVLYITSIGVTSNTVISYNSVEFSETNVPPSKSFGVLVATSTAGDEKSPSLDSSSWVDPSTTDDTSSIPTVSLTSHRQTNVHDSATVTLGTSYIEPAQTTEPIKSVISAVVLLPTQSSTKIADIMSTTSYSGSLLSTVAIDILNGRIAKLESDVTTFRTATIVLCVLVVLIVGSIVGIFLYTRCRPRQRNPYLDDEDQDPVRRPKVRLSMDNLKSMLFRHSSPVDNDGDNGRTNTSVASFKTSPKKHNGKSASVVMQMKEKLDAKSDSHMYGKQEKMKFEIAEIPETKDEKLSKTENDNAGFSNISERLSEVDLTTD